MTVTATPTSAASSYVPLWSVPPLPAAGRPELMTVRYRATQRTQSTVDKKAYRGVRESTSTSTANLADVEVASALSHWSGLLRARESLLGDSLAMFLLDKLVTSDAGYRFEELWDRLRGPLPWITVGRLMRAGLVDENGRSLYVTDDGRDLRNQLTGLALGD